MNLNLLQVQASLSGLELVGSEQWLRSLGLFQVTAGAWNTVIHFFAQRVAGVFEHGKLAREAEPKAGPRLQQVVS